MRVLVTGGAGYIGSVVTAQLLEAGHEAVVLDDLSTGHRDAVPDGARFVEGDLRDAAAPLLAEGGFDGILHFAAKSLVGESVARPELYWDNNVVGSLRLFEAAVASGVPRIVFSSTAATYGQPAAERITEDTPAVPINPYGQSKLAVDFMLEAAAVAHGLATTSLRYFNVGGALGPWGERHRTETHLIPNVLAVALGHAEAVSVFGDDYPTPDGTAVRDYLHVVDLGRAHLLALDAAQPGRHALYNLGSGSGYSVTEVVEACRRVTGHPIPVAVGDRRAGDPPRLVASSDRIRDRLGWVVEADLDRIVADAWAFLVRSG